MGHPATIAKAEKTSLSIGPVFWIQVIMNYVKAFVRYLDGKTIKILISVYKYDTSHYFNTSQ